MVPGLLFREKMYIIYVVLTYEVVALLDVDMVARLYWGGVAVVGAVERDGPVVERNNTRALFGNYLHFGDDSNLFYLHMEMFVAFFCVKKNM